MGYEIVVQLKKDAPKEKILEMLEENIKSTYVYFAIDDEINHPFEDYLYIRYKPFGGAEHSLMKMLLNAIIRKYGVAEKNFLDQQFYPCYYYDDMLTLLLTNDQKTNMLKYFATEYVYGYSTIVDTGVERLLTQEELDNFDLDIIEEKFDKLIIYAFTNEDQESISAKFYPEEYELAEKRANELKQLYNL